MISAFGVEGKVSKSQLKYLGYKAASKLSASDRSLLRSGIVEARSARLARHPRMPKGNPAAANQLPLHHLDSAPIRPTKVKNLHINDKASSEDQEALERHVGSRKLKRPVVVHVNHRMPVDSFGGGLSVSRPPRRANHIIFSGQLLTNPKHGELARRIVHHELTHSQVRGMGAAYRKPGNLKEEARADHVSARFSSAKTSYEQGISPSGEYGKHREHLRKSAFGVDHMLGVSKMSDRELRHRKRVQASLSTAGAVVGLSALGAKGVKVGAGKYLKPAAKAVKINTKIDNGVNNALVVGGGIGGAAGLNSASISRAESKKPQYIHKLDTSARGSNQHKRQIRVAVPRVTPKQRRHTALAASTGMLAGAGLAAGGNKKKLAVGLIAGGSALSGYAASDPNDYIKEKKVAKSAFGVEHSVSKGLGSKPTLQQEQRLSPAGQKAYRRAQNAAALGLTTGTAAHVAGGYLHNSGKLGDVNAHAETIGQMEGSRNLSRLSSNARKIKAGTQLKRVGTTAAVAGLGAAGVAGALGSRAKHKEVSKTVINSATSAFGVEHEIEKRNTNKDYASPERQVTGALFPVAHGLVAGKRGNKLRAAAHEGVGTIAGGVIVPGVGAPVGSLVGTQLAHRKGLYKPDNGTQRTKQRRIKKAYQPGTITYHHEQSAMHARKKQSSKRGVALGSAAAGTGLAVRNQAHVIGHTLATPAAQVGTRAHNWQAAKYATRTSNAGKAAMIGGATVAAGSAGRAVFHAQRQNAETKKAQQARLRRNRSITKAFDPEARRHTQLGAAAGVSGSVAAASGASALKAAHKARSHFRAASGTNETTKSRMLEGLGLKGAAQAQHARKTAIGHGEMLQHIRVGNTAARRARGKAGVALGTAAAAGAIVHHSNNGAANYVGPYQPKAKYAQGAKKAVAQVKRSLSS